MTQENVIDILRRKLDELQKAEAITADPNQRFQLQEQIKEIQTRLAELPRPGGDEAETAGEIAVVPKKLDSFDERDKGFFLHLLPEPYREDGLPESIFFWKWRIEETDGDRTFRVGVLYGRSGCGKSSLVKAGLLPHLAGHVAAVHVEATGEETETQLLNALRKRYRDLPDNLNLAQTCVALRDGPLLPPGTKLLIVLDQFEQWLHGRAEEDYAQLVEALLVCNGSRLQCLLLIRDDFWTPLTRFLKQLEVRQEEGKNTAMVDLFDKRHAKNVLALFGRALGALPKHGGLSRDQEAFLEGAVDELAVGGRIVCVKLALLAEIARRWEWEPRTLKRMGGMKGVGVLFLQESLSGKDAPPARRRHLRAAEACLKLLLSEAESELKGKLRSRDELLQASGYADRPDDFTALLDILERELRLIKTTRPDDQPAHETGLSSPADDRPLYWLTHDYLVPSVREWLAQNELERTKTWRGRAEVRLQELTALWQPAHDRRFLPGPVEFIQILLGIPWTRYQKEQRALMRAAGRWYVSLAAVGLLVLTLAWWGIRESKMRAESPAIVRRLVDSPETTDAGDFVRILRDEATSHRRWVMPDLGAVVEQRPKAEDTDEKRKHIGKRRADAAIALWQLGDAETASDVLEVDKDPESLTQFVHRCRERGVQATALWSQLGNAKKDTVRYGLLLALGEFSSQEIPAEDRKEWVEKLAEWYRTDPKSSIHSACGWLLRHWGETRLVTDVDRTPVPYDPRRQWFVREVKYGDDTDAEADYFTFIVFPPGKFLMGSPDHEEGRCSDERRHEVTLTYQFALCDREITHAKYARFRTPDDAFLGTEPVKDDHPVVGVSWNEAVQYCQWLTGRDPKLKPCYTQVQKGANAGGESNPPGVGATADGAPNGPFGLISDWQLRDGFRLPSEAEWELSC